MKQIMLCTLLAITPITSYSMGNPAAPVAPTGIPQNNNRYRLNIKRTFKAWLKRGIIVLTFLSTIESGISTYDSFETERYFKVWPTDINSAKLPTSKTSLGTSRHCQSANVSSCVPIKAALSSRNSLETYDYHLFDVTEEDLQYCRDLCPEENPTDQDCVSISFCKRTKYSFTSILALATSSLATVLGCVGLYIVK